MVTVTVPVGGNHVSLSHYVINALVRLRVLASCMPASVLAPKILPERQSPLANRKAYSIESTARKR